MLDMKAIAEATAAIVRDHVEKATAPLMERIAALEARPIGITAEQEASIVAQASALVPTPRDGRDVDLEAVRSMVADAIAALPAPKDGEPGKDVDPAAVAQMVEEAVKAIPPAQNGKDGIGLAGALIDRHGALVVTLTDGTTRDLGPVVGKDVDHQVIVGLVEAKVAALPKAKDGTDGFGFDDLNVEHDGERGFVLRFLRGDRTKEFSFALPVVLDRGVWRGGGYKSGDAVTWAGSLWIAQKDTDTKPDSGEGWRLAVKRGRDGKDVRPVAAG
jgi:hypothetical protein